jgi:hypothetical protein
MVSCFSQKGRTDVFEKHGRATGSSRDSRSPSTLKQRRHQRFSIWTSPADMSKRGSVGKAKKASDPSWSREALALFSEIALRRLPLYPRTILQSQSPDRRRQTKGSFKVSIEGGESKGPFRLIPNRHLSETECRWTSVDLT